MTTPKSHRVSLADTNLAILKAWGREMTKAGFLVGVILGFVRSGDDLEVGVLVHAGMPIADVRRLLRLALEKIVEESDEVSQ